MSLADYKQLQTIGRGSFGDVVLCYCRNDNNSSPTRYAMKKIVMETNDNRKRAEVEVDALVKLSPHPHPNVVAYKQYFEDGNVFCIVMEYCDRGDIGQRIANQKEYSKPFTEDLILHWTHDICKGLQHIHSLLIIHRDLKPQNIFLSSTGIKIGDFGVARLLNPGSVAISSVGSPLYTSPEVTAQLKYGTKADIWSLGCIVYELMKLEPAVDSVKLFIHGTRVMKPMPPPTNYSDELISLTQMMLTEEPTDRPDIDSILNWVKSLVDRRTLHTQTQHVFASNLRKKMSGLVNLLQRKLRVTRRTPKHHHQPEVSANVEVLGDDGITHDTSSTDDFDDKVGFGDRQCSVTEIQPLPLDLYEILLMSSARLLAKTLLKTDSRPDVQTFVTLASVCQHFYTILTERKWFAQIFQQYLTVACRPYRLRLPRLMTFGGQGCQTERVFGLTKLDSKLYVVCMNSDTIYVYTTQPPYQQMNSIRIKDLKAPQDMAACSINSCLYVVDGGSDCVWKVATDQTVDKWLDVKNVRSLSVTSDGYIVVLTYELGDEGVDRLRYTTVDMYNGDGVQLSSLELPNSIIDPHHVVQTVNNSFIVCHGSTELNRVCEVNNAGVLVKSCGGSRGSGLEQLAAPAYIALDSCEERIFLADTFNHRVLLLDKQLNIQRVLLTWSRDIPQRLIYDHVTAQLTVGLWSGKVEIYSIVYRRHKHI